MIGTTNAYIFRYMGQIFERFEIDPTAVSFLDVGCGTGWLEQELVQRFHVNKKKILAVDPSAAMLEIARERAPVQLASLPTLPIDCDPFDIVFCNSYQYLTHQDLEPSIERVYEMTRPGGLCINEFITQDHIRWYPNVVFSDGHMVVSLRNPTLHEQDGYTYQESEIINVSRLGRLRVTYEGVHRRVLVSPRRLFEWFKQYFGDEVHLFDAGSFAEFSPMQETCPSTRFVICARRKD